MIEIVLELKLDSFMVNRKSGSRVLEGHMPARVVRFSCEEIVSSRQLAENTPSSGFEFLSASTVSEIEFDKEFDEQLLEFLVVHHVADTSRVDVASEPADNRAKPEDASSGEIGRIYFTGLPGQSSLELELAFKHDEFETVWQLTTQQNIRQVLAHLVCFKPKQDGIDTREAAKFVAGILSASLQMMPDL